MENNSCKMKLYNFWIDRAIFCYNAVIACCCREILLSSAQLRSVTLYLIDKMLLTEFKKYCVLWINVTSFYARYLRNGMLYFFPILKKNESLYKMLLAQKEVKQFSVRFSLSASTTFHLLRRSTNEWWSSCIIL